MLKCLKNILCWLNIHTWNDTNTICTNCKIAFWEYTEQWNRDNTLPAWNPETGRTIYIKRTDKLPRGYEWLHR